MWMTLAAESNGSRDPAWRERDFDSLRRKFRKLYGKAKPTGDQGDRLTLKQRAIPMAHETQYEIEKKGGAHTSHDGRDNGEDDENLMDEVNMALFADEVGKTFNVKPNLVSTKDGGDSNRARIDKQQEDDEEEVAEEDDESVSSANSVDDEKSSEEGTSEEADANQPRDPPLPPVPKLRGNDTRLAGVVITQQGLVPVEFAADFQQAESNLGDGEVRDA
ncbi:hypothetical protein PHYSODRAFT_308195 [Phytophthora sojae]|uniref:DUF6818 domain-containing protein n=1 Tax=Phytophthora sojae (strain P6497) TaxID=1094619 RepID=G5AIR5_PHYSP|nr:hypothetical protein PHYSODRAFT_308195 [Phytophthora sojae]EGZ04591.1 hypothetical protein PHYSODRAFT_308195 [Phytophthora sojae]|eukprot:XP_009539966.1 hypothetical protein PHYSODRAFT_308195 [Phytophthora sojae]